MSTGFPWDELGLEEPGDRRAVKRAYAARLKSCRPEDDAEGFARLRRAYEVALAWAVDVAPMAPVVPAVHHVFPVREEGEQEQKPRPPAECPSENDGGGVLEDGLDTPVVQDAEPVDMRTRMESLLSLPPSELERQLADDATLWNLDAKDRLSVALAAHVIAEPSTAMPAVLLELAKFFHWDDVMAARTLAGHGVAVEQLQQLLHAAQIRLALDSGAPTEPPLARKLLRWGTGPRAWLHALWWRGPGKAQACLAHYPAPIARLVFGDGTVRLWAGLSGGWRALGLHLLRINLILLALVMLVRFPTYPESSPSLFFGSLWNSARVANLIALALFGIGVVRVWNGQEAHQPVPAGWSRRTRLGVLALLAATLIGLAFPYPGAIRTAFSLALFGLVGTAALFLLPSMVFGMAVLVGIGMVSRWLSSRPDIVAVLGRNLDFSQPWLSLFLAILLMMASHMALRELMISLRLPPMRAPSGFGAAALLLLVWLNLLLF